MITLLCRSRAMLTKFFELFHRTVTNRPLCLQAAPIGHTINSPYSPSGKKTDTSRKLHFDFALRDFGLLLAPLALGRLSQQFSRRMCSQYSIFRRASSGRTVTQ